MPLLARSSGGLRRCCIKPKTFGSDKSTLSLIRYSGCVVVVTGLLGSSLTHAAENSVPAREPVAPGPWFVLVPEASVTFGTGIFSAGEMGRVLGLPLRAMSDPEVPLDLGLASISKPCGWAERAGLQNSILQKCTAGARCSRRRSVSTSWVSGRAGSPVSACSAAFRWAVRVRQKALGLSSEYALRWASWWHVDRA